MNGKPYFLDYRERAPLAATRNMYLDDQGKVIPGMSLIGYRAVGVPGTVEGMWEAHRRFGNLRWAQDLAPAIQYAREGFVVDAQLRQRRDAAAKEFAGKTDFAASFGGMKAGGTFKPARTGRRADAHRRRGRRGILYRRDRRPWSPRWSMRGHGPDHQARSAGYRAVWRQPCSPTGTAIEVITAPPPSSGGIGLVQMLKMKADAQPPSRACR